jgi:hypothetical protein
MVLRLATLLPADRMSIIESDQPFALRSVQRQSIIEAVRLLRRHRYPRHDERTQWPPSGSTTKTEGQIAWLDRHAMLSD